VVLCGKSNWTRLRSPLGYDDLPRTHVVLKGSASYHLDLAGIIRVFTVELNFYSFRQVVITRALRMVSAGKNKILLTINPGNLKFKSFHPRVEFVNYLLYTIANINCTFNANGAWREKIQFYLLYMDR